MNRVQVTLSNEEKEILTKIAKKYGYRLTQFMKFVCAKEVAQYVDDEHYLDEVHHELENMRHAQQLRNWRKKYDPLE